MNFREVSLWEKIFLVLICSFILIGLTECAGNTKKESTKEYKMYIHLLKKLALLVMVKLQNIHLWWKTWLITGYKEGNYTVHIFKYDENDRVKVKLKYLDILLI